MQMNIVWDTKMKISSKKSLTEFYESNDLYRQNIKEGFFGELFKGILRAFAALFGIEIDENATRTESRANSRFNTTASDMVNKGKSVNIDNLKLF